MTDPAAGDEPLMDLRHAAAFLGVAPSTLQSWVWKRRVPFVKLGNAARAPVRFRPESLRAWVVAQEFHPEEPTGHE